jgi:putative hydrolase of the HAD superfamily
MQIEVVFFDAGGTLLYPDPPVGQVYADALREAGIDAEPGEVQERFQETWQRLVRRRASGELEYGGTEAEAKRWWRRVVRECFSDYGPVDSFDEMFAGLWEHFASGDAWGVYEDVAPTLSALREAGKGVGMISNWDARLERVLRDLGMDEELDWIVISHQIGTEKPGEPIFREALRRAKVPAGRALHVGDSYEEDVVGAQRAGLSAVWLRRDPIREPAPSAVPCVESLCGVLQLVQ